MIYTNVNNNDRSLRSCRNSGFLPLRGREKTTVTFKLTGCKGEIRVLRCLWEVWQWISQENDKSRLVSRAWLMDRYFFAGFFLFLVFIVWLSFGIVGSTSLDKARLVLLIIRVPDRYGSISLRETVQSGAASPLLYRPGDGWAGQAEGERGIQRCMCVCDFVCSPKLNTTWYWKLL